MADFKTDAEKREAAYRADLAKRLSPVPVRDEETPDDTRFRVLSVKQENAYLVSAPARWTVVVEAYHPVPPTPGGFLRQGQPPREEHA